VIKPMLEHKTAIFLSENGFFYVFVELQNCWA
jgi:hypothetical protein